MRALARDGFGRTGGVDHELPWGAAVADGGTWTVLVEQSPRRSFGHALVLGVRHDATSLDLLVEGSAAGELARRAELFDPQPTVWAIDGTAVEAAEPAVAARHPMPVIEPHIALALSVDEVATIVEHGEITAEYLGLEVGRVTGTGDEQRLDVGVGAYDQGAFAVMNPELTPEESFGEVLAYVRAHRRRGAEPHPLNRLVRERWLRAELCADPDRLGVGQLTPVEGMTPRDGLHDAAPCFALSDDARVLVACSVGIDLDLVPSTADVAAREQVERIVMVLPERDQHRLTAAVAERSIRPVSIVTADEPWA